MCLKQVIGLCKVLFYSELKITETFAYLVKSFSEN